MLYWKAFLCVFLIGSAVGKDTYKIETSCSTTSNPVIEYLQCDAALNGFKAQNGVIFFDYGSSQSCGSCQVTLSHPDGTPQVSHPSIRRKAVDEAIQKGLRKCSTKHASNATIILNSDSGISLSVLLDYSSAKAACAV